MDEFTYVCPTKVYFGKGSTAQAFGAELGTWGGTVMLAYGGGSVIHCCKVISAQTGAFRCF